MNQVAAEQSAFTGWRGLKIDAASLAVAVVLIAMTIVKFTAFAAQPLGIDEVWTGMIAGQRTVAGLIRQCQLDVNAPLAYVIAWLWAPLSGLSNGALRLPSILFVCAAPLVALAPRQGVPRSVRMIWACLVACWAPGILMADQARCYALVILLATANAAVFVSLLRRPTMVTALIWTSVSTLLILDHYFAALLIGCQGIAYLIVHREKAVRTWPAALAFAPAFASILLKAGLLANFAQPGQSTVSTLRLADMERVFGFLAGAPLAVLGLCAWILATWLVDFRQRRSGSGAEVRDRNTFAMAGAAGVAIAAALISIAAGFLVPILSPRYLTIFVPGVFLGLAMLARHFGRRQRLAPVVLVGGFFGLALWLAALALFVSPGPEPWTFSFQPASEWLMARRTRQLIFFWDNPAAQGADPDTLAQVGGFFFNRAGTPIPVDVVRWRKGVDPNALLLERAQTPGAAILWIYDRNVPGTLAKDHPPMMERMAPSWSCQDFGGGNFGVVTCQKRTAA